MVKWIMLISWIAFGVCMATGLAYSVIGFMEDDE